MYVMSVVHTRFFSVGVKSRFNTFSATGSACLLSVVSTNRFFRFTTKSSFFISLRTR